MYVLYAFVLLAIFGVLGLFIGLGWFVVPILILFGPAVLYILWWLLYLWQERTTTRKGS